MTDEPLRPGTLRVGDLAPGTRAWLLVQRFDRFVEKHEGPWDWATEIEPRSYEVPDRDPTKRRTVYPPAAEFLWIDGRHVLLPVGRDHHEHLRLIRSVVSDDGQCLTLFVSDERYGGGYDAGRFAFCERAPDAGWYLCTVWHEWYAPR